MEPNSIYGAMKNTPARMLALIITMALVVVGSFSVSSAPANAADNVNNTDDVNELLDYVNDYREELGLQRVKVNYGISRVSTDWAVYLADTGYFGHNPNYAKDSRVYSGWSEAGEIIAMNPRGEIKGLVEQWKNSTEHNKLMTMPSFNLASIGLATDQYGQLYGVMNFYNYRYLAGVPNTYDAYPAPGTPIAPGNTQEPPVVEPPVVEPPVEEPTAPAPVDPKPTTPTNPKPTTPTTPKPTTPAKPKPTTPAKPKQVFTDVDSSVIFKKEIETLASKKVSTGWYMKDGTQEYRPYEDVKRDAMIVFIYRAMGSPAYTPPKKSPFTDVSTNFVFYKEIAWAYENGIAEGWKMKNGTRQFRPLEPVKRDAVAAFLMRASGEKAPVSKTPPFSDVPKSTIFVNEIAWMKKTGISTGWKHNNTYQPYSNTKRDAMAAFVVRWMDHTGHKGTK